MKIPYRIEQIATKQFAMFPEKFVNGKPVEIKAAHNFGLQKNLSVVRCTTRVQYFQDQELLMMLEVACCFGISPEGTISIKKERKIPAEFLQYMASIVVGTARGIIHAKTAGTVINHIVLPPINLTNVIRDDMLIEKVASDGERTDSKVKSNKHVANKSIKK